ncbi:hypothetical protein Tco_1138218, partial [Tanacetum coccineum]
KGPNWLFDLDYLTDSMNYQHVTAENKANKTAGPKEANHSASTQDNIDAKNCEMEAEPAQEYFVLLLWSSYTSTVKSTEAKNGDEKPNRDTVEAFRKEFAQCTKDLLLQAEAARATSTNIVNTISTPISTASPSRVVSAGGPDLTNNDQDDSQILAFEEIYDNPSDRIFTNASYDDEGAVADFSNLETTVNVSPIPTSRIHSIHPTTQIFRDPTSTVQTKSKVNKSYGAYAFVIYIQKQRRNNHKDFQHCMFACFLSQIEPKKISQALEDESWIDAMVFLNNQIELGEPFNDVYITPAHTLKVFSNMSRKGLKFLGRITPLFSNMVLALETSKDAQAAKILKLKTRIKKPKKK